MKLTLRFWRDTKRDDDEPVFITVTAGGPRAGSLGASVVVHGLFVLLLVFASHQLATRPEDVLDWSKYDLEMIRIRIEEPLYFRANQEGTLPKSPSEPANGKAAAPAPAAAPAAASELQLPAPRQPMKNAPVMIQPELNPQPVPPPTELPPMAFWARRTPAPPTPKPAPSQEVVPGRIEKAFTPPKLAAPPSSQVPNQERVVAEINVSMPMATTPLPARLAVQNSATTPVRVRAATEAEAATFDRSSGQPVNVIAMGAERNDIRNVAIPKGLQNLPPAAAGDSGTTGAAGVRLPAPSPAASAALASGSPPRSAVPAFTKIEHPANGNFDVVLMQSTTRDDVLSEGEKLSGNPVYSVYLRVGDQKEWILEYCVPTSVAVQVSPYQINVDDGGSITPPYPISTTIPNSVMARPISRHIVLHGFLSATGSLRAVRAPVGTALSVEILSFLSQWQFRPALRNKSPIEVEILLVIPARG